MKNQLSKWKAYIPFLGIYYSLFKYEELHNAGSFFFMTAFYHSFVILLSIIYLTFFI